MMVELLVASTVDETAAQKDAMKADAKAVMKGLERAELMDVMKADERAERKAAITVVAKAA